MIQITKYNAACLTQVPASVRAELHALFQRFQRLYQTEDISTFGAVFFVDEETELQNDKLFGFIQATPEWIHPLQTDPDYVNVCYVLETDYAVNIICRWRWIEKYV